MADEDVLAPDEVEALREVLAEFKQSVGNGAWERAIQAEAKKRVSERRQDALRSAYQAEVAELPNVEARLRLRDDYRKRGLEI